MPLLGAFSLVCSLLYLLALLVHWQIDVQCMCNQYRYIRRKGIISIGIEHWSKKQKSIWCHYVDRSCIRTRYTIHTYQDWLGCRYFCFPIWYPANPYVYTNRSHNNTNNHSKGPGKDMFLKYCYSKVFSGVCSCSYFVNVWQLRCWQPCQASLLLPLSRSFSRGGMRTTHQGRPHQDGRSKDGRDKHRAHQDSFGRTAAAEQPRTGRLQSGKISYGRD